MAAETDGDLLDLDTLGDLQMYLPSQNGGLLRARVMLVIAL
jgi:hypothetical protein